MLDRQFFNLRRRLHRCTYVVLGVIALFAVFAFRHHFRSHAQTYKSDIDYDGDPGDPGIVRGELRFSAYGPDLHSDITATQLMQHVSVYVNGPYYHGMKDNDLRGYLDGNYKYDWNQPGQIHIRVGRRYHAPAEGEDEVFRDTFRWADIKLPPGATVRHAALRIKVEEGPRAKVWLMLYAIDKDFNPGHGGVNKDNVSSAKKGEVWWDERAAGVEPWGLPGAGFASDHNPAADTPTEPLAAVLYHPGDDWLEFTSPQLAAYAIRRLNQGRPLLFLLKVADYQEDIPGALLELYSGNCGARRWVERRPHLILNWESPSETLHGERSVILEYSRTYELPRVWAPGTRFVAATFRPQAGAESPAVEIRGGNETTTSLWQNAALPVQANWNWFQIRLREVVDPVILGQAFDDQFKNTWVTTGPREKQVVPWTFIAPSGKRFQINAQYKGSSTWSVHFVPTELGRWQYYWCDNLSHLPFHSATGIFDVVAGDQQNIRTQLKALYGEVRSSGITNSTRLVLRFGVEFNRLERAALQSETPQSYASDSGIKLRVLLNKVRDALADTSTKSYSPDSYPDIRFFRTNGWVRQGITDGEPRSRKLSTTKP